MSKNTVASDWTARILRFNGHTPTGRAALAIQLSSADAGAVFEFHLSGAASGPQIPDKLNFDVDCDSSTVSTPFAASSIQGANGRAFLNDEGILFLAGNKSGAVVFTGTLNASISNLDCVLAGIWILKHVTNLKASASSVETFTNPPKQRMMNDVRSLN